MSAGFDFDDCTDEAPGGPFYEGWCAADNARQSGVPVQNPYEPGTVEHIDWQGGWNDSETINSLGEAL